MTIHFGKAEGVVGGDFIYERKASTMAFPVPPNTTNYILISWAKPLTRGDALITAIGTDQHDNSSYTWVVDGVTLPVSGTARAGSIFEPFVFPNPVRVKSSVVLYVTNNNAVAYPNNGLNPSDQIPYEGVMIARWA
jgi:hypothetical protein